MFFSAYVKTLAMWAKVPKRVFFQKGCFKQCQYSECKSKMKTRVFETVDKSGGGDRTDNLRRRTGSIYY